jgi:hypothetical protein
LDNTYDVVAAALAEFIKSEASEDVQALKVALLKRIVDESEVKPTRMPAPLNITEIGGYYNLMEQVVQDRADLQEKRINMQLSLIASVLGLPV